VERSRRLPPPPPPLAPPSVPLEVPLRTPLLLPALALAPTTAEVFAWLALVPAAAEAAALAEIENDEGGGGDGGGGGALWVVALLRWSAGKTMPASARALSNTPATAADSPHVSTESSCGREGGGALPASPLVATVAPV